MVFQFVRNAYYGSDLYDKRLRRRPPTRLYGIKTDPLPGDPTRGVDIVNGSFLLAARALELGNHPWDAVVRSEQAFAELHGFSWLRDLAALTGEDAKQAARNLTAGWLKKWGRWDSATWAPHIAGTRLSSWINHIDFLTSGTTDTGLRDEIMQTAAAQAYHLAAAPPGHETGNHPFARATGLVVAAAAMPDLNNLLNVGLEKLEAATIHIHSDGGHRSRSPEIQAAVLASLVEARSALKANRAEEPVFLTRAIQSVGLALKTLMLGDGALAVFNGGTTGRAVEVSAILAAASIRETASPSLLESGFERLSAGPSVIIADAGGSTIPKQTHSAGALSFEMSVGRHRMVVNCGAHPDETTEWSRVLRTTAAHSTLSVNDTDALPSQRNAANSPGISGRRNERQGSQLIQLRHEGYRAGFGIVHNRDLYLSKNGDDFRGKDVLVGGAGTFGIRFHLHPEVSASLLEGGQAVLLKLGKNQGWRFRASEATISLEESVYLGRPARPRRCQQIVLRGETIGSETTVRWSFLREGA